MILRRRKHQKPAAEGEVIRKSEGRNCRKPFADTLHGTQCRTGVFFLPDLQKKRRHLAVKHRIVGYLKAFGHGVPGEGPAADALFFKPFEKGIGKAQSAGFVFFLFRDLEGKTIYTIQNGTPAVILRHLLKESGVNATVRTTIGEGSDEKAIAAPTDLAPLLIAGKVDIALVPEPVATAAPLKIAQQEKDYTYKVAINLTDAWAQISSSPVAMGCIVVNKNFASEHKYAINSFLKEYKASIEFISSSENIDTSAQYIVDAGVLDAVPAAKKSLTNLGSAISYIDGAEMKTVLTDFYNAIGTNLIGGKLPDDEFYYGK